MMRLTFLSEEGWVALDEPVPEWTEARVDLLSGMASELADMSSCCKGKVGCIVTDMDLRVQAVGHNRKPLAIEHLTCEQLGCDPTKKCRLTTHAEVDAFSHLDPRSDAHGHCIFLPKANCLDCLKHCIARNVKVVVFAKTYNIPEQDRWAYEVILKASGIRLYQL